MVLCTIVTVQTIILVDRFHACMKIYTQKPRHLILGNMFFFDTCFKKHFCKVIKQRGSFFVATTENICIFKLMVGSVSTFGCLNPRLNPSGLQQPYFNLHNSRISAVSE